jgi:hypothetical protein
MAKQRKRHVTRKPKQMPVNNVVFVSDEHCGCCFGLCPADKFQRDEGGLYQPSIVQQKIWGYWEEFWGEWVPLMTKGEPFAVVSNGDALDGAHHNSTTQISQNPADQLKLGEMVLKPVVEAAEGRYYHIRGTPAHSGEAGCNEETLAKVLGAKPDECGNHARNDLWLHVGNALCHFMHHVGTTSSSAHEASAVNAELTAEFVEAARWGERPPDFVIRSHRHRAIVVDLDTHRGYGAGIVTPGWQAKTPFAWKIAGARLAPPQFGGFLIRQGDREFFHLRKVWTIKRSREEYA